MEDGAERDDVQYSKDRNTNLDLGISSAQSASGKEARVTNRKRSPKRAQIWKHFHCDIWTFHIRIIGNTTRPMSRSI